MTTGNLEFHLTGNSQFSENSESSLWSCTDVGLLQKLKNKIPVCDKNLQGADLKAVSHNPTSGINILHWSLHGITSENLATETQKVSVILPGDLALACNEKLTSQKHLNAELCPGMCCNDS